MKTFRHIALMPIMNAGDGRIAPFDFDCGARVAVGCSQVIRGILPLLAQRDDLSRSEVQQFQVAQGWLWKTSEEAPAPIQRERNVYAICGQLASKVWDLAWWIDLAGGGENTYWGGGNNIHCAGVYLYSVDSALVPVLRQPYVYSIPCPGYRDAPWSESCMIQANTLEQILCHPSSKPVPRVLLANRLRYVMMSWDARQMTVRFQLCASALETLFVALSERLYLWDTEIRNRVRQACPSLSAFSGDFFEAFKARRNDVVHRAGLDEEGSCPKHAKIEMQSEVLLREGLLWALLNYDHVGTAFESDNWPSEATIPPASGRCGACRRQ